MRAGASDALLGIEPAFLSCVGELGMWSAARMFVNATWEAGGAEAVRGPLLDTLGSQFPVISELGARACDTGAPIAAPSPAGVLALCQGLRRLVVIGVEAAALGPLVDALPPALEIALVVDTGFPIDEARLRAAWTPRVQLTSLGEFQRHAGAYSALLTAVYGANDFHAAVCPAWPRVHSPDVRTQFRRLIGWDLMGSLMSSYPRWMVETARADFTDWVAP